MPRGRPRRGQAISQRRYPEQRVPGEPALTAEAIADIEALWREWHDIDAVLLRIPTRWHDPARALIGPPSTHPG